MKKLILPFAVLMMFASCSNPTDGGTGDDDIKGNTGNQPEITDTTIAVPDSGRSAGTTGMPGVNTVTGDTMTRYLEHTTGFSGGSGTEEQIQKNGNKNNQDNQKR